MTSRYKKKIVMHETSVTFRHDFGSRTVKGILSFRKEGKCYENALSLSWHESGSMGEMPKYGGRVDTPAARERACRHTVSPDSYI